MKKILIILAITLISCNTDDNIDVQQEAKNYLFDGAINGQPFRTDSLRVIGNSYVIGDSLPLLSLTLDTIYIGEYHNYNGFSAGISIRLNNGSILSWGSGANSQSGTHGDLTIESINDSTINGYIDYTLVQDSLYLGPGEYLDTIINVKGKIEGLKLN